MTDITSLGVADTGTIHLKGLDGEFLYADAECTKPRKITVYSPGSKAAARLEGIKFARIRKRIKDNGNQMAFASNDEAMIETTEDLTALTVAFENISYEKLTGQELYSAFYADTRLGYLTNQVSSFVADWGNFKAA